MDWTEQVRLGDRAVVDVERHQSYQIHREIGAPSRLIARRYTIDARGFDGEPLRGDGIPVFLEKAPDTGRWIVLDTVSDCNAYATRGRPASPYFAHELIDRKWVRIAVPKWVIGRQANLSACPYCDDNAGMTLEWKDAQAVPHPTDWRRLIVAEVPRPYCAGY